MLTTCNYLTIDMWYICSHLACKNEICNKYPAIQHVQINTLLASSIAKSTRIIQCYSQMACFIQHKSLTFLKTLTYVFLKLWSGQVLHNVVVMSFWWSFRVATFSWNGAILLHINLLEAIKMKTRQFKTGHRDRGHL